MTAMCSPSLRYLTSAFSVVSVSFSTLMAIWFLLGGAGFYPIFAFEQLCEQLLVFFCGEHLAQVFFVLIGIEDPSIHRVVLARVLSDLTVKADIGDVQLLIARDARIDLAHELRALVVILPARVVVEQFPVGFGLFLIFFRSPLDSPDVGPDRARGMVVAEEVERTR